MSTAIHKQVVVKRYWFEVVLLDIAPVVAVISFVRTWAFTWCGLAASRKHSNQYDYRYCRIDSYNCDYDCD